MKRIVLITSLFFVACTQRVDPVTTLRDPGVQLEFVAEYSYPLSNKTAVCSGTETVSGEMTKCYSAIDNVSVPFSKCSGLIPATKTYKSPSGILPSESIFFNGVESGWRTMQCDVGNVSGPFSYTCKKGYHDNYSGSCDPDIIDCPREVLDLMAALSGVSVWNGVFYNACDPTSCMSGRFLSDNFNNTKKSCQPVGFGYYNTALSTRKKCPDHSSTKTELSLGIDDCVCDRFFSKNDSVCTPVASAIPVLGNIGKLVKVGLIYWNNGSNFDLTFTPDPSQRVIRIYSEPSCGQMSGTSGLPLGDVDLDSGKKTISINPLASYIDIYAQSENDAGQKSTCTFILGTKRDDIGPTALMNNFSNNTSSKIFVSDNDGVGFVSQNVSLVKAAKYSDNGMSSIINSTTQGSAISVTSSNLDEVSKEIQVSIDQPKYFGFIDLALIIPKSDAISSSGIVDRVGNRNKEDIIFPNSQSKGYGVKKMTGGKDFICFLTYSGSVSCIGDNTYGQINPQIATPRFDSLIEINTYGNSVIDMAAGNNHLCLLFFDGSLRCRGLNDKMQLGTSDPLMKESLLISTGSKKSKIWAGGSNTCFQNFNETIVYCVGNNSFHQMGRVDGVDLPGDNKTSRSTPVLLKRDGVSDISDIYDVGIADNNICVVARSNGEKRALCSGDDSYGQLGQRGIHSLSFLEDNNKWGLFSEVYSSELNLLRNVQELSAGANTICAIVTNPSENIACWGQEPIDSFNLNNIDNEYYSAAKVIFPNEKYVSNYSLDQVVSIYVDKDSKGLCTVTRIGSLCWGYNRMNGAGLDRKPDIIDLIGGTRMMYEDKGIAIVEVPVDVGISKIISPTGSLVADIVSASSRQCFTDVYGGVSCWGASNSMPSVLSRW